MKRVAILGVTGYIGKSLLHEFLEAKSNYKLFLFSRSIDKIKISLKDFSKKGAYEVHSLDEFSSFKFDVIINCTGIGNPLLLQKDPANIFTVTEEVDSMIISYLFKNPKTMYINLSSGAVYGDNFKKAVNATTQSIVNINNLKISEYYAVAKINAEAKHRSLKHLHIVDIRVFAFFSRFVDTKAGFFMSEITECLLNKKVFKTSAAEMVRDYSTSPDLFSLVRLVIKMKRINDSFDLYSKHSISKQKLLEFLKKQYGLRYEYVSTTVGKNSVEKNIYCSTNKKAKSLGYEPKFSSLEGIDNELKMLHI